MIIKKKKITTGENLLRTPHCYVQDGALPAGTGHAAAAEAPTARLGAPETSQLIPWVAEGAGEAALPVHPYPCKGRAGNEGEKEPAPCRAAWCRLSTAPMPLGDAEVGFGAGSAKPTYCVSRNNNKKKTVTPQKVLFPSPHCNRSTPGANTEASSQAPKPAPSKVSETIAFLCC